MKGVNSRGAVAAGDAQTAQAGAEVLRAGGNAVDAACAAGFTSFVVEPPLSSPGGAGVAVFGSADTGFSALDFFSDVPGVGAQAGPLDFHAVTVDFGATTQQFHVGRGAAAVPSALPGLLALHRLGGSMSLQDVMAPAVRRARHGFSFNRQVAWIVELLRPILTLSPGVRALFCRDGVLVKEGVTMRNDALADFLEATARDPEGTLRGPYAGALLRDFGPARGGLITRADLDNLTPTRRDPLVLPLGQNTEVILPPAPASGGTLVALALRLCEGLGLEQMAFLGRDHLRAVASVLSAVSAARADGFDAQIRDPDAARGLLSDRAVARWRGAITAGATERALGSTTHISVLDGAGGGASVTLSNGEGCGHVVGDLGFQMNNFLGEEDINPTGFHQTPPGVRMTTMMTPTLVLRDGRPTLALGSGGSNRIRSAVFQMLAATELFGRDLDSAIAAARMHIEGDHLWLEDVDLPAPAVQALLEAFPRHARFDERSMFFGGVNAVSNAGGVLEAAADARRGGGVATA